MKTPTPTPKCLKNGGFVGATMQSKIAARPHAVFQGKSMMSKQGEEKMEGMMGGRMGKEDRMEKK